MLLPLACKHNLRDATWAKQPSPTLVALASFSHFPMFPLSLFPFLPGFSLLFALLLFCCFRSRLPSVHRHTGACLLCICTSDDVFARSISRQSTWRLPRWLSLQCTPSSSSFASHPSWPATILCSSVPVLLLVTPYSSQLALAPSLVACRVQLLRIFLLSGPPPTRAFPPLLPPSSPPLTSPRQNHFTSSHLPSFHLLTLASPIPPFFASVYYCLAHSHHTHTTAQPVSARGRLSSRRLLSSPVALSPNRPPPHHLVLLAPL